MAVAIRKDNKIYYNYSSIFPELNYLYGITPKIKREVYEKIEHQKRFLNNTFLSCNGEVTNFSLMDLCNTANIQPNRYHGEIWSRVSSLRKYADLIGFTAPVFLTITPKSYFKPTKQIKLGNKEIYKIVDNPKFMAFHDGGLDYVKQSVSYISEKWRKFLNQRLFNEIKNKYGTRPIYMRTYEPHVDGTPHAHLVVFIPPEFKERFCEVAKGFFNESRFDIKTEFDGDIGGVVSYILKYILKSFENSKKGYMDETAIWYAYHGIRRFTTSRTLIPLTIFRKINKHGDFKDMYRQTLRYKDGAFQLDYSYHPLTAIYKNISELENTDYKIMTISFLSSSLENTTMQVLYKKNFDIDFVSLKEIHQKEKMDNYTVFRKSPTPPPIEVIVNGTLQKYLLKDGKLVEVSRSISTFSRFELLQYYYSLDVETCDLHHFGFIKNTLIKKGLLNELLVPIDDYNTEILPQDKKKNPFEYDFNRALLYYKHRQIKFYVPPFDKKNYISGV